MKRFLSTLLAMLFVLNLLPPVSCAGEASPIGGTAADGTYTWNFGDASGKTTLDYTDGYAAIRIGLGEVDSISASGISFSDAGCKEPTTPNFTSVADTNRYILITPKYSGTVSFSISFTNAASNKKGRFILKSHTGEMDSVELDKLVKANSDDPSAIVNDVSSSAVKTGSFEVEADTTYSLHTYNAKSIISNLKFTSSDFPSGTTPEDPDDPVVPDASGVVKTFDFDSGDNTEWTNATFSTSGKTGGAMQVAKNATAKTTITGIPQGSYTVSMWVKDSTANGRLTVSGTGGPDSVVKMTASSDWGQIAHRNVLVYNGQMTLEVTPGSGSALLVDDIQIAMDSNDNNPVANWDFENGLTNWTTKGTATIASDSADTGNNAVRLADQSEVSQKITVKPDTDYIATVRMKVDVEDTYKSTPQYAYQSTTNVLGVFVERVTLGNRVNLGVRGAGGTVLRQAPAGTADYSLVTIAFHTGASQTEVELYANTIYDQNYKDSVTVYENTYGDNNKFLAGWQRPNPNVTDTTHLADNWTSNGNNYAYVDNFDVFEIDNTYIKGADMSFLPVIEDCGGKYFANGVQQDALRILSNHGVNSITTMLFVHSGNEIYNWSGLVPMGPESVDFDGNPATFRKQVEGYFDKIHSTKMALRAQELGMTYMPGFHYSDTWISNAKAHMPYEWFEQDYEGNLSNGDIEMLTTAVYNYVHDILSNMKSQGVENIISIKNGNEQDGGLIFPVAQGSKQDEHAAVVSASAAAAHDVYPGAINTIHSNSGHETGKLASFFNLYTEKGADYDGMAFSLYAGRETTVQYSMMLGAQANENLKYRDYINVETGMTLSTSSPVGDKESTMALGKYYDTSPTGQYNYLLNYIQAPLDIPNPYGTMRGFYYWNAEAIAVFGAGHKVGETVGASKRTLFNNGTASIKSMGSPQDGKMGDMSAGVYAYLHRGHTKTVSSDVYTPLQSSGVDYSKGTATGITLEKCSLAVGERTRLHPAIAPADKVLDDYSVSYTSSDTSVAEVSPYGFVTGKSAGTATITAKVGKISATATVTVTAATQASGINVSYSIVRDKQEVGTGTVSANQAITARPYDKVKFTAALDSNPTNTAVIYSMDETDVAEWYGETWQTKPTTMRSLTQILSSKNIQPIVQLNPRKEGTVAVTVKSADGKATLTFQVTVEAKALTDLEIVEGDSSVQAGKTLQLTAKLTPEDATLYKVNWSSADETVAAVDENGLVTGIKPGTTTITVTSEAYPNIKGTITLTVTDVLVEQLLLSRETLNMTNGSNVKLTATVTPDNAVNKIITWSVTEGTAVTVSADGTITANAEGTAKVTAANTSSGVSAVCTVVVQASPVEATGMSLSEKEVWVKSNYFSPNEEGRGDRKPVYKLEAVFEPSNATYTDITWTSSNDSIVSVNEGGVVTAHKSGMVIITATAKDGALAATAAVYVPAVSEDWENYELDTTGGFTDSANFTNRVIKDADDNKVLQAVGSGKYDWTNGTFDRLGFDSVGGDGVIVELDWNVGTVTNDRGGLIAIQDSNNQTWLALACYPPKNGTTYDMAYYYKDGSTAFDCKNYIHGGSFITGTTQDAVVLSGLPTGNSQEYKVHLDLDFTNRTIGFTITDKNDPAKTVTVPDIAMSSDVSYKDNVGSILFSHAFDASGYTWTTSIDNLAVYNAGIAAEEIEYSVDCINDLKGQGIKLVPVKGALSAEAKINASVLPSNATQNVVYTVSDELKDYIEVSSDGKITVKAAKQVDYNNQSAITSVFGTVRISSTQNPAVYADVVVQLGPHNASETQAAYVNGTEYSESMGPFDVGAPIKLSYEATGGDGTTDVYSYSWTVKSGSAKIENDVLTANQPGAVEVEFVLVQYCANNSELFC